MLKSALKRKAPKSARPNRKGLIQRPTSVHGKSHERLFDKVALEFLHGHRSLFDELTTHEKELVLRWMSDALVDGTVENSIHDILWEIDYHRKPVDIETFIMDDHYLGDVCGELHPLWVEDLKTVFAPQSKIFEWIMTGAIGIGKTTVAMVATAYKLHCLACLRDAPSYYGLLPQSLIIFGIYSITKRQVADTGYFQLRGYIDTAPYFRLEFPRSTKIDSQLDFEKTTTKKIKVIAGCLAEGTCIATPSGSVPIEQLPPNGGVILSAIDTVSTVRYSRVVDAGMKKCVDLVREDGIIVTVAASHRIEVIRNVTRTFVEARDIRPGEVVLGLRYPEADKSILSSERQATAAMQGVCEGEEQRALPRHEELQGQGATSGGSAEAVLEVSEDKAPGSVQEKNGPVSWRDEDVLAFLVQGLRVDGCKDLVQAEHKEEESVRQETAFHASAQATGEETLAEVLRGESRYDFGAYVIARRPFQTECAATEVAQEECRQGARVPSGVAAKVSLEEPEACTATANPEEVVTGYAYAVGHRTNAGVLWRKVLLLWSRPVPANLDVGPCGSVDSYRGYNGGEYCTLVLDVQCEQARLTGRGILSYTFAEVGVPPEGKRCVAPHPSLSGIRIVAVRPAGIRQCYDIVEAGPRRSFFAGGLSVRNSQELHALGLNLFSFSMDEVNFMREKSDKDKGKIVGQAYSLYNATFTRIMSRFLRPGGMIPGIMLLLSSRNAQTSFLEQRLKEVRGSENTYVSDYALWTVKDKTKFIKPKFTVEVGDRIAASRILREGDKPRNDANLLKVPGEFRKRFEEDVDQALRDIAGVATFNVSPLIRDRKSVFDSIRTALPNPFIRDVITLDVMDDVQLAEFWTMRSACRIQDGRWVPKINPAAPRVGHTDIGLTGDCAGIAMGHISGIIRVERTTSDGTTALEEKPFIIIDFMLRIKPPPGSEIDLSKIRAFWFYIRKFFPLIRVTFDGFQSVDSMQIINKQKGLEAGLVSMDKTHFPYDSLRSAHFDRRLAMYEYMPYTDEVLDLERHVLRGNRIKIDHPTRATKGGKGSKDVADAVGAVVWTCITDERITANAPLHLGGSDPMLTDRIINPSPDDMQPPQPRKRVGGRSVDWENLRGHVHI